MKMYQLVAPTSMGVRITPTVRQPVHVSDTFFMQATSAESNVLSIPAALGMKTKVLTTFVKDSPIARFIQGDLRRRGIDIAVDFVSNMGGIRIYEALVFGIVGPVPEDIVRDTETIIRQATRRVFEEAKRQGKSQREVARELFEPDVFDTPDI